MLENRDDYEFLTENALKRIDIKGAPYPVRSQKLVVTGEDEAYLREAMLEREYIMGRSPAAYSYAILRITQTVLRAKWMYDSLVDILAGYIWKPGSSTYKVTWMDADKVEDYASVMPSGAVVSLYGENPAEERPQAAIDAINDAADDIADLKNKLADDIETRYGTLADDIDALYDTRDSLVEQAQETRDTAIENAESSLQSALEDMKTAHEAALEEIAEEYQQAMDDPDADQDAARKKYEEDTLNENNNYAMDVSERRDKARLEKAEAEDDYRKAVWDAECDLYDRAKEKFQAFADDVKELEDTCYDDIVDVESTRNQAVASAEQGAVCYHFLDMDFFASQSIMTGDGVLYSDALAEMADTRKEMEIDRLCLDKYLRKTPLLPGRVADQLGNTYQVFQHYAAHAPSSDATMRAYADLERMRCLTMPPPYVYRNAYYTGDPQDIVSYNDTHIADDEFECKFYDRMDYDDYPSSVIDFSDTSFSVFFGRRMEVDNDLIEAIYATVKIFRSESAYSDSAPYAINRTFGFMRVKLENKGIVCASDLSDIDAVRDKLARDIADLAETRDAAYKAADDTYYLAIDNAQKTHDDAVSTAEKTKDEAYNAAYRTYMSTMEAADKAYNDAVRDAEENEDIDDKERGRLIEEAFQRWNSSWGDALSAVAVAKQAASTAYDAAVADADIALWDAQAAARQTHITARDAAGKAFYDAVEPLQQAAQEEIDEIKDRPAKRRQDAMDAYDAARDAARDSRGAASDAALDAFNAALYSLTVDGEPILPNHDEDAPRPFLRYTSTFPYRTLTSEAYDDASQSERDAFYAAFDAASNAYDAAVATYNAALKTASYNYWLAKKDIGDIREDARCRWSFTPEAIDSDGLSLPSGDNSRHSVVICMAGIEHFDVVYKPKSLTGVDFSDYYAELDGEAATGPTAP